MSLLQLYTFISYDILAHSEVLQVHADIKLKLQASSVIQGGIIHPDKYISGLSSKRKQLSLK